MARSSTPATHAPRQSALQPVLQRAASYVRVSTEEQAADGYGLDVQRGQARRYVQAFGLDLVDAYADEGSSGTKDSGGRPGLAQALDDARIGGYDRDAGGLALVPDPQQQRGTPGKAVDRWHNQGCIHVSERRGLGLARDVAGSGEHTV